MKKDKPTTSFVNIGSSSLLIIFLILSLVTFAILSLSSARSDYTFSQKLAAHKTEYYTASNTAEEIVAKIDETLEEYARKHKNDPDTYRRKIRNDLDGARIGGSTLTLRQEDDGQFLQFSVPMSDTQALRAELKITDYQNAETYYEITAWQVVSTDSWENDQTIQLLPMGE